MNFLSFSTHRASCDTVFTWPTLQEMLTECCLAEDRCLDIQQTEQVPASQLKTPWMDSMHLFLPPEKPQYMSQKPNI